MTRLEAGDIVLLRFPFSDLASRKRRPVVVVNPAAFSARHGDIVVIPLTGAAQDDSLRLSKWREAGLRKPTWLKPMVATVTTSLVEKSLGTLRADDNHCIGAAAARLIDAKFLPTIGSSQRPGKTSL
jgi:mRNA interferase MazF